jgi:hypothetical protein
MPYVMSDETLDERIDRTNDATDRFLASGDAWS